MKNNYIYNILIFILILALLLLFINNSNLIEGMGINTSELDYNKNESMDIISDNPGDADAALDSKMLDGVKDKPKLMSDTSEQGVRDRLDYLEALIVGKIEGAFNSVNKVVPQQTLKARDIAYSILSYKDEKGDPLISSDLDKLRMTSDGTQPSLEYMGNMNVENFELNLDDTEVIIFEDNEVVNVDRDQCNNPTFTTMGNDCPSMKGTNYSTTSDILTMDTAAVKMYSKLGSTNKSIHTPNDAVVALDQRIEDAADYSKKQLSQLDT